MEIDFYLKGDQAAKRTKTGIPLWRHLIKKTCLCEFRSSTEREPAAAAAKSLQSCPTLCGPIDGSPPGFPVPGTLQARTLEWVAIAFSNV